MTTVAEIRFVALKPLPVQMLDGERLVLQPGDIVPGEIEGRWLDVAIEAGKVVAASDVLPSGDGEGGGSPSAASLPDNVLRAELEQRGYTVRKRRAA